MSKSFNYSNRPMTKT